jgi:hypothetical protein
VIHIAQRRKGVTLPRKKITVTLPEEQIKWLEGRVIERTFANLSHGVELCIREGQKIFGTPKSK